MNSKQRRKNKRHWKYSVITLCKNYEHYSEMWDWLDKNYGRKVYKCGWRDRPNFYDDFWSNDYRFTVLWEFNNIKKYVEFKLVWT